MEEPLLWIALRNVPGLQRRDARLLVERLGGAARIFGRSAAELRALCSPEVARALESGPDLGGARAELERARHSGLRALLPGAPDFPELLRAIPDPPLLLYLKGELPETPTVSIVGARKATARGRESARMLAAAAARAGITVVSGLAYGIDAAAHEGALEAGGASIAVLASGLDRPSPAGNRPLARRILRQGGAWLSEYPPGVASLPHQFPERNRLISGLSGVTLIVEAREKSGSLWTARHALDQGRDVLVVPGPIDTESCRGSNRLLREGAGAVLEPAHLLAEILPGALLPAPETRPGPRGSDPASRTLALLREGPADVDELARALELSPAVLAPILLELELAGRIARQGSRVALRARA